MEYKKGTDWPLHGVAGVSNTVLMEMNGWKLLRPLMPNILGCASYMIHQDCAAVPDKYKGMGGGYVKNQCVHCGLRPPDGLVALHAMHNADF